MKNDTSKRVFPRFGDLLLIVILFLLVQCAMLLILKAFGIEAPVEPKGVDVDPEIFMSYEEQLGRFNAVMYPVLMFFSIVTIWLYARLRGGKGVVSINHSIAGFNPSVILVGVLWLVSSQILIEPLTTMMPASDGSSIGRGVWAWITALAFAPIFEELLCRGCNCGFCSLLRTDSLRDVDRSCCICCRSDFWCDICANILYLQHNDNPLDK